MAFAVQRSLGYFCFYKAPDCRTCAIAGCIVMYGYVCYEACVYLVFGGYVLGANLIIKYESGGQKTSFRWFSIKNQFIPSAHSSDTVSFRIPPSQRFLITF